MSDMVTFSTILWVLATIGLLLCILVGVIIY